MRLAARKTLIPSNTKNSGASASCDHPHGIERLVSSCVAGFLFDRIDQSLAFVRILNRQIEHAPIINL